MPEFVFKDGLRRGIRDNEHNEINSERLTACFNARPHRHGLIAHTPIEYPAALVASIASKGITVSHPFPQIFKGSERTLLFTETEVYSVNDTTWALNILVVRDIANTVTTIPSGGGAWQFADFGGTWWAFNGIHTLFYCGVNGNFNLKIDTSVPTQTGCNFNTRAIFGGFSNTNYWNAAWMANMQGMTDNYVSPTGLDLANLGSNYVSWSSIGGGDTLSLIYPNLAIEGQNQFLPADGHDAVNPIAFSYWERNECGFMPMDWDGTVWCVKQLGHAVVVYGDNGISALVPFNDPFPSLGLRPIRKFGIASRTAVGGDERLHTFMDSSGKMWQMGPDLSPVELGYQEPMSDMVPNAISIAHDPQLGDFHITGTGDASELKTFTLTETGLYEHKHAVTSAFFTFGGMVGIYEELPLADQAGFTTDTIDFDSRSIKTISSVEYGGIFTGPVYSQLYYRNGPSAAWRAAPPKLLNARGATDNLLSGVEFRLTTSAADYTDLQRVDYIKIHYSEDGVRNFRGTLS